MAEETGATPETTDVPVSEDVSAEKPDDTGDESLGDAGQKALDAFKKRAREAEKKAKEALKRADELENEKLTEGQRVKKEAEEAQARAAALEARVKRAEVRAAAASKEIGNPDLVADLIDPSKVELDEGGAIANADELLDALLEKYPDLKAKPVEEKPAESLTQVLENGDRPLDQGVVSAEQALHLAKSDPDRFNKLFEEGKIPASALSGSR